jgi:hypothetical protein
MAKPGPGGVPLPRGFAPPFAASQGFFLCQAGTERQVIFQQLAHSPMTGCVTSRLPMVQQRVAQLRATRGR